MKIEKGQITPEEREFANRFLSGNKKAAAKRLEKYEKMIARKNECLNALAPLAKLPGGEVLLEQFKDRVNLAATTTKGIDKGEFDDAKAALKKLQKEISKAVAKYQSTGLSKDILLTQTTTLKTTQPFPEGRSEEFRDQVSRGIGGRGAGPKFGKVLSAMKAVEKDPSESNLQTLETAATNYLNGYDPEDQTNDPTTQRKAAICKQALLEVDDQRKYGPQLAQLKPPPWNGPEETNVRELQAKMLLDRKPAAKLGAGKSGASESFFIPGKGDENAFIFKPGDGENVSGYGWVPGGGAPREVMVSALNETLKEFGIDCGVGRTSLMNLDHNSLATPKNGNNSQRVGAAQNFVADNGKALGDLTVQKEDGKKILVDVDTNEVQKVLLLDFVTLQLDRNDGNVLLQDGPDGKNKIVPIDAGNSLPTRDAFEAKRRSFTAGALFGVAQAEEPLTDEVRNSIEAMDPEKVAAAMRTANETMAGIDPNASVAVAAENIEMVKRSVMFLKKAIDRLGSPKLLGMAYQYALQKVFDAPPNKEKIEQAIEQAIRETLERVALVKQLEDLNYEQKLKDLGWPTSAEFSQEDPAYTLEIIQADRPNPAAVAQVNQLIEELGGQQEANRLVPNFDQKTLGEQVRTLSVEVRQIALDPASQVVNEGGDQLLLEANVDTAQLTPKQKAAEMWKLIYVKEGGDRMRDRLVNMGFKKIPVKYGGPFEWVDHIRAWNEYERLGGDRRHIVVGGSGHPGQEEDPKGLLASLKMLEAQFAVRENEVRQGLQDATRYIQEKINDAQQVVDEAMRLYEEAQDYAAQLPEPVAKKNAFQASRLLTEIKTRREQLIQSVETGKLTTMDAEVNFYRMLPNESSAVKVGQAVNRKQVIQNGIDKLIDLLTGERQAFVNYPYWLERYSEIDKVLLKGTPDPLAVYRILVPNDFKKLTRQELAPVLGIATRVGIMLEGVGEKIKRAKAQDGNTVEARQAIKNDLDQIGIELVNFRQQFDSFEQKLTQTTNRYPPNLRQQADSDKVTNRDLLGALQDLLGDDNKGLKAMLAENRQLIQKYGADNDKFLLAYQELSG